MPEDAEAGLWILVGVISFVIILCVILKSASDSRKQANMSTMASSAYRRWLQAVKANGGEIPEYRSPISLEPGEECLFYSVNTVLMEPRAIRSGNYGGASVRVARGISLHTGGFGSESHDEFRRVDRGTFCITNRRVVFSGSMQTRVIKVSDIVSLQSSPLVLALNSAKLKRAVVFEGANGLISRDIINAVRNQNPESEEEPPMANAEPEYATQAQINYIEVLGGKPPRGLTKAAASKMIDSLIEQREIEQIEKQEAKLREKEEAELRHVAAAMSAEGYKPRKSRSKRLQDLRDFQYLLNRVFEDEYIEPSEAKEIIAWLEGHRVLDTDFVDALELLPGIVDGTATAESAGEIYTALLDCLKELRARPSL